MGAEGIEEMTQKKPFSLEWERLTFVRICLVFRARRTLMSYPKKPRKISSLYGGHSPAWLELEERQSLFPKPSTRAILGTNFPVFDFYTGGSRARGRISPNTRRVYRSS